MAFIEGDIQGDAQVLLRLQQLPTKLRQTLIASITRQTFRVQAEVVTGKLSGDPLHRRTGNLASSINTVIDDGAGQIVGRVGTKVRYGKVHEDGGTFEVPAHARQVTQVFGRAVTPHAIQVRAHSVTFPQRSFLRSTLRDLKPSVIDAIERDIAAASKEA